MDTDSTDVKGPFGKSVRVWRMRLGISQEELAHRAGLHRTYVCDVERGARNVTLRSIQKLAQALDVIESMMQDGIIVLSDVEVIRLVHSRPEAEPSHANG